MADDNPIKQDEIERLLAQAQAVSSSAGPQPPSAGQSPTDAAAEGHTESLSPSAGGKSAESGGQAGPHPQQSPETGQSRQSATENSSQLLGQEDIEKLLHSGGTKTPPTGRKTSPDIKEAAPPLLPEDGAIPQGDIEYLLNQAQEALASINTPSEASAPPGVTSFRLEEFAGAPASSENATLDLIRDVELDLKIELGRTHMYLEDVLRLRKGSVVPLDKLAGDPVDIYVNGRLIARGEVLVLNDNFCVRVAELISGAKVGA